MTESIPLAQKINYKPLAEDENKCGFVIEPLYPGYGLTLGNALRRVLLSSLSGAAIKAVKINGVEHEFSTLDWVKEDVVDIILNLKQVRIKLSEEIIKQLEEEKEELRLRLDVKGEKEVKAADFEKKSGVDIVNPRQTIATLTDAAAHLEMEVVVGYGRGYLPTEARENEKYEVGMISIDAIYTPIKRVGYEIENVRVGQMTNWDRLTLNIETDGTITPPEAFDRTVNILIEQFSGLLKNNQQADVVETDSKAIPTEERPVGEKNNQEIV